MATLHVDWLEDERLWQGGCWAIFAANGHLVATMAQKGWNGSAFRVASLMVGKPHARMPARSDLALWQVSRERMAERARA